MGDVYTNPPQSRNEAILRATIDGTEYTAPPQSRIEDLLLELKEAIEQGGGAGGMSKDTYDPDDAVATAGGIAAYVDDEITDLHLGTASTKNSTSVVTQSTDLVESGAVYTALQSKADNSVIGKVEGANASKAWSVGEHFINGGQFKKVTQPIASGGAISSSNTVDKPIADCLVKQATFSGTTSAIGALIVSASQSRAVISAEVVGYIVDLYKRSEGYGAVVKTPQGEPVVETSVSGTYYYI